MTKEEFDEIYNDWANQQHPEPDESCRLAFDTLWDVLAGDVREFMRGIYWDGKNLQRKAL